MGKEEYQFEDFLAEVAPDYTEFVEKVHELLSQEGYKTKVESKSSGLFISYSHPKTRKSILNFFFRKKGFFARVYADNIDKHTDFLERLPEKMEKEIAKAPVCKRLINPESCNPKCIRGYDFFIKGSHHQKCRYSCFQFEVDAESVPFVAEFVGRESKERLIV